MLAQEDPKPRRRTVAALAAAIGAVLTTVAEALTIGAPFIDALIEFLK